MWRTTKLEVRPGHRLYVEFSDGASGEVDVTAVLRGPMADPLKDEAYFALAYLDEFGVVAWPNGFDLAPEVLHARISAASGEAA
jgi:hypothetical protein